jgi:hypothetical protein
MDVAEKLSSLSMCFEASSHAEMGFTPFRATATWRRPGGGRGYTDDESVKTNVWVETTRR